MTQDLDELDIEIKQLEHWIDRAADGLLSFYVPEASGFRRSTLDGSAGTSATSTARALFAVAEYVRFLQERGDDTAHLNRVSSVLTEATTEWVLGLANTKKREQIRARSDNNENHFTDSHLLMALSLLPRLHAVMGPRLQYKQPAISRAGDHLRTSLIDHLSAYQGGKLHDGDPAVHDFITLHALRAIDAFDTTHRPTAATPPINEAPGLLSQRVERDVLARLGYHSAGVYSEFDPAELMFTASLLERCQTPNWRQLLHRVVSVVVDDQTTDGAWVGSRVVAYEQHGLLHVASYEVGLTLTFVAASAIRRDDDELLDRLLPALRRVCALARASFQTCGDWTGWANDRTRWPGLLESWATAIVLTMLMRYRETLLDVRQCHVLRGYRCKQARRVDSPTGWADLHRTLRVPGPAPTSTLGGVSDPSTGGKLVRALRREILTPIMRDPAERPDKAGLILYGTPGTRKTTMVKELAKALDWPMITLSPPDFLGNGGLEGFEAAAAQIFTDLNRLRRAVVLFDECEDFFRPRPTAKRQETSDAAPAPAQAANRTVTVVQNADRGPAPETRTIGAFITAGMLPRLQDLRDARWTLFVLATNVSLDELDDAAIRPGRFDFAQDIGNPTVPAQVRYAKDHREPLSEDERAALVSAIKAVNQTMPFRAIDVAAKALCEQQVSAAVEIKQLIEQEHQRTVPPALC